jgi:hypothetical protein
VNTNTARIALAVLALSIGACNSVVPDVETPAATNPSPLLAPMPNSNLALGVNLGIVNKLLPGLACLLPDTLAVDVGPAGGTITLGASKLVIPAGSLTSIAHIIMLPALGNTVAVQFFPEGLVFNASHRPTLTLNTDCIGNPANAYIEFTDNQGHVQEIETTTGRTAHTVSAEIKHFSRYAVAW